MLYEVPTHYFLCAGAAEGYAPLNAFDQALLAAGIGDVNLVRLSSILPPRCRRVEPFQPPGGALVPTAYSQVLSSTPGEVIAAAVAVAIAEDPRLPGVIMEFHAAQPLDVVLDEVREMARQAMKIRERSILEIQTTGVEHKVTKFGAAFAGVVLWNRDEGRG